MIAPPMRKSSATDRELDQLDQQCAELAAQIDELAALPERMRELEREKLATLPPPDDWEDRVRQVEFKQRYTRRKARNERRAQGRSVLLLSLLIATAVFLVWWGISLMQR